jgi:hypothetical protein
MFCTLSYVREAEFMNMYSFVEVSGHNLENSHYKLTLKVRENFSLAFFALSEPI